MISASVGLSYWTVVLRRTGNDWPLPASSSTQGVPRSLPQAFPQHLLCAELGGSSRTHGQRVLPGAQAVPVIVETPGWGSPSLLGCTRGPGHHSLANLSDGLPLLRPQPPCRTRVPSLLCPPLHPSLRLPSYPLPPTRSQSPPHLPDTDADPSLWNRRLQTSRGGGLGRTLGATEILRVFTFFLC